MSVMSRKVLRVIPSMDPRLGGPSQGIRNLIPEIRAHGVETDVLSLDEPGVPFLPQGDVNIIAIGPGKGPWRYGRNLGVWLRQHLGSYDTVIAHGLWQYPVFAVRREVEHLRLQGKAPKFFVYPHGMLDPWFQRDPSRRAKALRNGVYWRLIERRNINAADAVLFTCEEERRLAGTTFPGYRATEEVVGYGIPAPPERTQTMGAAFRDSCPSLLPDQPYFLFLGRIHSKKGVDLLIRAYVGVAKRMEQGAGGKRMPALVIAGPLDSAYAREMQSLAAEALPSSSAPRASLSVGLGPMIHFPGMLQGDAKWGAFYGCEAFVLPSHQENFGIAVVEALACGKPALVSDKVNIWREVIKSNGGLAEDDSLSGTVALLEGWARLDGKGRARMGRGARMAYEQFFTVDAATERLVAVL